MKELTFSIYQQGSVEWENWYMNLTYEIRGGRQIQFQELEQGREKILKKYNGRFSKWGTRVSFDSEQDAVLFFLTYS
jgi:isocitrate dehydrogenase